MGHRAASRIPFALAALGVALLSAAALAQAPSVEITTTRIASGLAKPVWAGSPPGDDRLFVVEQSVARIRVIVGGLPKLPAYLELGSKVLANAGERGLLGLAFDPDFASNGWLYVCYSRQPDGATVVERYTALDEDSADPESGVVILGPITHPQHNHNGGQLAFGPDGKLYLGTGDGGNGYDDGPGHVEGGNAQSGGMLLGKMLRMNADGSAPADNPFADPEDGFLDLIWHYGVRNPWRWSFDRLTGDFWLGDVGEALQEELDVLPAGSAGLNFGWRCMEGMGCTGFSGCTCGDAALTLPLHVYSHGQGRCAIIGGSVYRGAALPELHGTYFFADWCSSTISGLTWDGKAITSLVDVTGQFAPGVGQTLNQISSFGEDKDGELLILDLGGEIYRLVRDPFTDLGGALPGGGGAPRLQAEGALLPNSLNQFVLTQAAASASTFLFLSLESNAVPFKGGTLQTFPYATLVPTTTTATGTLTMPFVFPTDVPSALSLYFQCAIVDPQAIQGVAISNALHALTP